MLESLHCVTEKVVIVVIERVDTGIPFICERERVSVNAGIVALRNRKSRYNRCSVRRFILFDTEVFFVDSQKVSVGSG